MIIVNFRKNILKVIMAVMLGMAKSFGMANCQVCNSGEERIEAGK